MLAAFPAPVWLPGFVVFTTCMGVGSQKKGRKHLEPHGEKGETQSSGKTFSTKLPRGWSALPWGVVLVSFLRTHMQINLQFDQSLLSKTLPYVTGDQINRDTALPAG